MASGEQDSHKPFRDWFYPLHVLKSAFFIALVESAEGSWAWVVLRRKVNVSKRQKCMLYNPHPSACTTLLSVGLGIVHHLPVSSRTTCAVRVVNQQRNSTSRMRNHQRERDWWPKINTIRQI